MKWVRKAVIWVAIAIFICVTLFIVGALVIGLPPMLLDWATHFHWKVFLIGLVLGLILGYGLKESNV